MSNRAIFDSIFVVVGGVAAFLFGAADGLFYALVAFVALDYVTGIIGAAIKKKLSSQIGFKGIFKKIMLFVLVDGWNLIVTSIIRGFNG